jgi:hypothetical protein
VLTLSKWLQTNPMVVLLMFFISLTSGVAGLLLGWDQLYTDYLSKSVTIPVWLLLLISIFAPGVWYALRATADRSQDRELIRVEGKRFGVQQVVLDGKSLERCEFHGTEVIFEGTNGFSMVGCSFIGPRFSFTKNAAIVLAVMTKLYADAAFRPILERTLENIRRGEHPQPIPATEFKP